MRGLAGYQWPKGTAMATILHLPIKNARPPNQSTTTAGRGMAEIVIFPGIRYEYWDEPVASPVAVATEQTSAPDKPKRRRN